MKLSTQIKTVLLATVVALLLACGGGGSSGISNELSIAEQLSQIVSGGAASAAVAACL